MPNLVGIGLSQVPTNSMLGGLAYQSPDHASIKDLDLKNLSQINSEIADTAVDVFIYDTSKDSDGGAWRKRTQHTSWYNETLNTSTRGSRREFPAVAVIVAEQNFIKIYDGDDPDLPMWMVFNTIAGGNSQGMADRPMVQLQGVDKVVYALNGILATGTKNEGSNYGQPVINFISEKVLRMDSQGGEGGEWMGTIAQRNEAIGYRSVNYDYVIAGSRVNDIAMTVLPNAPIDDATGLPIPTIAVATSRGVSIIKDDGSIADLEHDAGSHETCRNIVFSEDKTKVLFTADVNDDNTYRRRVIVEDIPSGDSTFTVVQDDSYQVAVGGYDNNGPRILGTSNGSSAVGGIDHLLSQAAATSEGVTLLDNELDNILKSKVAYVTTDYNTGWMQGDIKGAFLSDTDTTNVSADTLNAVNAFDGTFATSTGWTANSDWSISGGVATCNGNDSGRFIYPTTDRWSYGRSVVVEITVTAYTSGTLYVSYSTGGATSGTNMTATGTYKFVNVTTGNELIYFRSESFVGSIDNVKIYYTEEDRSVNNNGLIPYGTITKSAVATGAELVAYSGWSSSNFLRQPYNSDMEFGTGDFYMMAWIKNTNSTNNQKIITRDLNSTSRLQLYTAGTKIQIYTEDAGSASYLNSTSDFTSGEWVCVIVGRKSGTLQIYVNGKFESGTGSNTNTARDLSFGAGTDMEIGRSNTGTANYFRGSIALARVGAGFPSPEQIKKIYEDEKVLFQENAKATLYGSSDAVTALAYDDDTDLLHVGTSSGRSDFQGLRRINNTTTAVTTAITAQNEFIIEQ